jgi:two-component system chemotaxis response regulator CheY
MARILIVDDSGLSRRISRTILEDAGHEVVEAEDGISALERYYLDKPDLVLLDITMRGMNGFEVLDKLREMDAQARVVVATADIQSSTREMTRQAGAMGFVNKPLAGEQVARTVAAVLRGEEQWS